METGLEQGCGIAKAFDIRLRAIFCLVALSNSACMLVLNWRKHCCIISAFCLAITALNSRTAYMRCSHTHIKGA